MGRRVVGSRAGRAPVVALDAESPCRCTSRTARRLRDQIVRGSLRPGARIASTRTLASELARLALYGRHRAGAAGRRGLPDGATGLRELRGRRAARAGDAAGCAAGWRNAIARQATPPSISGRGAALSAVVITGTAGGGGSTPVPSKAPGAGCVPDPPVGAARGAALAIGPPGRSRLRRSGRILPLRRAIAEHIASRAGSAAIRAR